MWLVGLGLMNSVVSAFYYVRVLKAMFLRPASGIPLKPPTFTIRLAVVGSALTVVVFGLYPRPLASETLTMANSQAFAVGGASTTMVRVIPDIPVPKTIVEPQAVLRTSAAPPERTTLPGPSPK